jgi:serine/threonine protein kinase
VRDSIADYEVLRPWGRSAHRFICRPPARLRRESDVLVSRLAVDAEGWQQLCDSLIRLVAVPGGRLLEVLEVGPDLATGDVFVVSEAVDGGTLSEPDGPVDSARRVSAMAEVARGAHALHEAGLAHGGIHPGAVLLTGRGAVLDLPPLDAPPGQVTMAGPWPELVSVDPELLCGEAPSRASDIWALGAALHTALSDRPLFPGIEGDEPITAVQRVLFSRPEPDPAIPSRLRALIGACVAADPADRPPTAEAVAERLEGTEVEP